MTTMTTMTTTAQRPTGATFKDPLLQVLARLTGGQPNRLVEMEKAITEVCLLTGIGQMDHGVQASSSKPQVVVWIQVAWQALKDGGLAAKDPPRGRWGLSPAGIAAAQGTSTIQPAAPKVVMAQVAVAAGDPLPPAIAATLPDAFHTDPYIRKLAMDRTPCLGAHSTRSPVCAVCTLQTPCRTLQNQALHVLAAQWKLSLDKPKTSGKVPDQPAAKKVWDNDGSDRIICAVEAVCCRCNKVVPKDAECFYQQKDAESSIFHVECW